MSAQVIDGIAVATKLRKQIAVDAATFSEQYGRPPGLATILIGDDPASAVYVASKQRACAAAGIEGFSFNLPADATREQAIATIEEANADPAISGIICTPDEPVPTTPTRRPWPERERARHRPAGPAPLIKMS